MLSLVCVYEQRDVSIAFIVVQASAIFVFQPVPIPAVTIVWGVLYVYLVFFEDEVDHLYRCPVIY